MGKFEKGQSGNPGGRPREVAEVRELARLHTPEAVATLVEIMQDKDAPPASRVSAANSLLDRGFGRPQQALSIGGDVDEPIVISASSEALFALMLSKGCTDAEISQAISSGNVIE